MRFIHSAQIGLLFLLPVALLGCGSDTATTPTVSTDTTSTNSAKDASTTDASKSDGKVTLVGDSGLQFTLPPTWKSDGDKDSPLYSSADDLVTVSFESTTDPEAAVKKDIADMQGNEKNFKNYKEDGSASSIKVDNYDAIQRGGTVELSGTKVVWEIDTVKAKTPVVILTLGLPVGMEDKAKTQDVAEYKTLMASVKATP